MKRFIQRHAEQISGVLCGFDRLRFRGTNRWLAYTQGMKRFLDCSGVLLKDFKSYVEGVTSQVRQATQQLVKAAGRPLLFLSSSRISKEETARRIAAEDQIQEGLICVFNAVEPCFSYEVHRDAEKRRLELRGRPQKCGHYYFYLQHPQFGFMHLRLQTWFPLTIHIAINGREWLARQLDAAHLGYQRYDNCFVALEDPLRAQALCDEQLATPWQSVLDALVRQYHPSYAELFPRGMPEYYWTIDQSEWATDILFRSPAALAQLYPALLRHAAYNFQGTDVMRYMGRRLTAQGRPWGNFRGEVVSDVAERADHLRVKHRLQSNWLKMYDKQQQVLRVEATLNNVKDMKTYRRAAGDPTSPRRWRSLRKSVADTRRRAQISQAANARYLDALAAVHATQSLGDLTRSLSQPAELAGRRVRALQVWSPGDRQLLEAISRPEFLLNGFRNKDLRGLLYSTPNPSAAEQRRQSAAISRKLRLLRAHGLILKVPKTHRYQLTTSGREILAALQAARETTPEQLAKLAA